MQGSGCRKQIEVFVPSGYFGKMVKYKCGNTGMNGYPVLCEECEKDFDAVQFRREIEECGERIEDDY